MNKRFVACFKPIRDLDGKATCIEVNVDDDNDIILASYEKAKISNLETHYLDTLHLTSTATENYEDIRPL